MNTPRIITDDFTSATDGVVAFAQRGFTASVILGGLAEPGSQPATQTVTQAASVDTGSRHLPPAAAAQRVAFWARHWAGAGLLVKQFDSTLRGPLAAECLAALGASGRPRLLVAPAFPAAGRLTVHGQVLVDGVPVHQTAFAQDPLCPVRTSSLPELFAASGLPLQVADDAQAAQALFAAGAVAVAVDITSEAALQGLAGHFIGDRGLLWAGSTGIVRALAGQLPPASAPAASFEPSRRPWALVGSRHPRSHQQADQLARRWPGLTLQRTAREAMPPGTALHAVVRQTAQAVRDGACDGLVATGGETAHALATALQATELAVLREVEPGVPLCLLRWPGGVLPLVTKAGGFGDEHTLVRCIQALQGDLA